MSETKHSPEPWHVVETLNGDFYLTDAHDDHPVVRFVQSREERAANARRIVACVNTCAGIPTEALESGALAAILDAVETEHDESSREIANEDHSQCGVCCALRSLGRLK